MIKVLLTAAEYPQVHFLEKWLPGDRFVFGTNEQLHGIIAANQVLIPDTDHPNYVHALLNICLDNQISVVYPMKMDEQNLLSEAFTLFYEFGIRLEIPDTLIRELLLHPYEMLNCLVMENMPVVPFFLAESFDEFSKGCLQMGYPATAVSFTTAVIPGPVWQISEQKGLKKAYGFPVTFSQAAYKLKQENEMAVLIRPVAKNMQSHWTVFEDGQLKGSWLILEETENQLLKNLGNTLKLTGIYHIQIQDRTLIYNLSTLFNDFLF
ncbi:MAG: hypothetical protein ACOH2A_04250 [Sphingobacteriaceae bacterium]